MDQHQRSSPSVIRDIRSSASCRCWRRRRWTAVADVRSAPMSRFSPHFNKAALAASLAGQGIDYVFLGKALGGRPERAEMYTQRPGRLREDGGVARIWRRPRRADRKLARAKPSGGDVLGGRPARLSPLPAGRPCFGRSRHRRRAYPRLRRDHRPRRGGGPACCSSNISPRQTCCSRSREERLAEAYRARARKASYAKPQAPSGRRQRRGAGCRD